MLNKITLQNFRNYSKKSFEFDPNVTLFVGPNAIGKTNILEAIYTLATGKSFRAENERDVIKNGSDFAAVRTENLEILFDNRDRFQKLYRINGVGKRQHDFAGQLKVVLFAPMDIEIVADSPSTRRRYLDSVLSQAHKEYRLASHIYERALRQRNRLLWRIREENLDRSQLDYWNELLITNGQIVHDYRRKFIDYLNARKDDFFPVILEYDHSIISKARLDKYAAEEIASATTLVGPQRDDFKVFSGTRVIRSFGSRGEQRMAVFTIKLGELEYIKSISPESPILLLDDIFSELDHENRHRLLGVIPHQQTIMTTTDLHLVEKSRLKDFSLVPLGL